MKTFWIWTVLARLQHCAQVWVCSKFVSSHSMHWAAPSQWRPYNAVGDNEMYDERGEHTAPNLVQCFHFQSCNLQEVHSALVAMQDRCLLHSSRGGWAKFIPVFPQKLPLLLIFLPLFKILSVVYSYLERYVRKIIFNFLFFYPSLFGVRVGGSVLCYIGSTSALNLCATPNASS